MEVICKAGVTHDCIPQHFTNQIIFLYIEFIFVFFFILLVKFIEYLLETGKIELCNRFFFVVMDHIILFHS